ncbi:SMP-30/gluconolactonase/LRE family protein [Rhabdobacter roseus]|uniref:Sugar lactone lactonase YvrE/enterochelin esterase-like enzyme n=1 Tax=Rhabdobacter roseus TaxID=1655419 RepID=A0A840TKF6_9BACT|nr:SMP-30/gluconolactonase/LRE family protein [Rhabdobacter roseus]MBB5282042.1 sugar lactone lactonase YvrE/enterochelin esterase-like enzyme [Rhabdobacter roseus]
MKPLLALGFILCSFNLYAQAPTESYAEDSASVEQAGVPRGEVLKFTFENSRIFPGTWREYWVYVPAQYRPDQPACVYVNQDGIQWKAPTVFDNLIHRREMPITIGVFVMPGRVRSTQGDAALDRFNRSFEYDGLGDAYARFILEEILPEVEKQKTSDGRPLRLSKNGNDRAIGGSSSGAVCAFTAAWERPDAFSRVFSAIGTYVGLRGADRYTTLVRKYEPKPIRIFLQDGTQDLNIYAGDWWKANESMERSLVFAGYDVKHIWGEGGHNNRHGAAVFPEAMRWLWRDYPRPITAGRSGNQFLMDILIENSGWELVGEGYTQADDLAVNADGAVFFRDISQGSLYVVRPDGKLTKFPQKPKKTTATAFGADGKAKVLDTKLAANDLVVAHNGNSYVLAREGQVPAGKLYLVRPNGSKVVVDEGLAQAHGLALSPDQTQLYVTESASHWVWVFQVQADGTLAHKQRYGWLHVPDTHENAGAAGLQCDRDGRMYVSTLAGIQVLDQLGRVNALLPVPKGSVSEVCFGGPAFDTLYIICADKVYRRPLKVRGAQAFEPPHKPAAPKL